MSVAVTMSVMWWWALPIGATLTAWCIVLWQSRSSVHRDPVITVQRLHRFKGAMARMHNDEAQDLGNLERARNVDDHDRQARS